MALIAMPIKATSSAYVGALHLHNYYHLMQNRHSSVPRFSQPCPINVRLFGSWRVFAGPGAPPSTNLGCSSNTMWSGGSWSSRTNVARAMGLNKAYDRFRDAVNQTADLGVNLAERKQAINMIVDRVTSLRLGYLDLRRGRFDDFARRFRLRERGKVRRERWTRPKDASKWWLEYHFGWTPLLSDIHDASDILQAPFSYDKPVKGRGTGVEVFEDAYEPWTGGWQGTFKSSTHIQARVSVLNPNLHRATQLGLTNPLAIAWELVPFSFLVDWFIPVGNFLNSWSDFLGLQFSQPFTTSYDRFNGVYHQYMKQVPYSSSSLIAGYYGVTLSRSLEVAKPVVYPKQFKGLSVTRGATAVALLITVLKS